MRTLPELFERNKEWAGRQLGQDPSFFENLAREQKPQYLWIGCSDSRVPANEIVALEPGEMFVHRNIGNVVVHSDMNCLSVIHYAVEVLKVPDIIVCGHYGCGAVRAALEGAPHGLVDNWLGHIRDIHQRCADDIDGQADGDARVKRLCELNVIEQVRNVCRTTIVQDAWRREQPLAVHGWIYDLHDGLLRDLGLTVRGAEEV